MQDNEAFSIFGNVDFEITDRLVLTLGANYTKDKKQIVTNSTSTDVFSNIDLVASGNTAIFAQGLATQVGTLLGLGRPASQTEIGAFAGANPAAFAQVSAGVQAFADANEADPAVNPLLALTPFQFLPPMQNCPNAVEDCSTDDDDWSWNVRLAYEVSPTLNVYASWATGYKAPSFNLSRDSRPLPADFAALQAQGLAVTNLRPGTRFANAENSEVYEVGIKGNWDRAAANLTFFQQSIEDFQANTFTGTSFILSNAGKQETFGIEFDGQFYASDSLTLSVAMTYLDAQYDSFVASPVGDLSGEPVAGVPELSAVLGAQYNKEINSRGDRIILRGDFAYSSPVQMVNGLTNFIVVDPATGDRDFGPARCRGRCVQARGQQPQRVVHLCLRHGSGTDRVGAQPARRPLPHHGLPGRGTGQSDLGLPEPAAHLRCGRALPLLIGSDISKRGRGPAGPLFFCLIAALRHSVRYRTVPAGARTWDRQRRADIIGPICKRMEPRCAEWGAREARPF